MPTEPDEDDVALTARVRRAISGAEASDAERLQPPPDLWGRIALVVAEDEAEAPPTFVASTSVVEYWIDASDRVVEVGGGWADFAQQNDAPDLVVPDPDRTLWSHFDPDIREIWQLLVQRVRESQNDVQVPLRCDAPSARRWFDITITPEPADRVHFRSVLAFEEPRPFVPLLDRDAERDVDAPPVLLCSWCGRSQYQSEWRVVEDLVAAERLLERPTMPPVSYGICGSCRDDMSAALLSAGEVSA